MKLPQLENEIRHPENAKGVWFVTDECIDCGLCYDIAPEIFKLAESGEQAIVFHQPETERELELSDEAKDECPVEAIEC